VNNESKRPAVVRRSKSYIESLAKAARDQRADIDRSRRKTLGLLDDQIAELEVSATVHWQLEERLDELYCKRAEILELLGEHSDED
jgi:hypothetical protein